jgi:hypothetical protein
MSEINDSNSINPTNDVFLCAICGRLHPSGTIFCEHTGRVLLPAEMIPYEDTIECPFCGQPHQKELHYCPETGRLMPILESAPLENTQSITKPMATLRDSLEDIALDDALELKDDMEDLAETNKVRSAITQTKTVIPTQRYGKGKTTPKQSEIKTKTDPAKPQSTTSTKSQLSTSFNYDEELARYRANQSLMMVTIAILFVGLIVAGFFIFQLTQQVNTLENTVNAMQEMLTEVYAKIQILGQ